MDLATFERLLTAEGQRALGALPPYDDTTALSAASRLRNAGYDAELSAAALTQARLRRRALGKFGDLATSLYYTEQGLEQATRSSVAAHHARRFRAAGAGVVADLCCGIGGDALALAAAGLRVLAVDHDPLTAVVARANAVAAGVADRVEVRCADVRTLATAGSPAIGALPRPYDAAWIDPARRDVGAQRAGRRVLDPPGRRVFDPAAFSPPYSFVLDLAARVPATGAKLAPGLPHSLLPANVEAEWVSDGGDVKEVALWFGPLATPGVPRRATLLPGGTSLTGPGDRRAPVGPVRRWLYEPDGAVIRAGLVAEVADLLDGTLLDPTIAFVSADRLVPTPFATPYEVTDALPFGVKPLRAVLRERGVGHVVVKKRGSAVEPDQLIRQLRLRGDASATIVLTRVAGRPTALLVSGPLR